MAWPSFRSTGRAAPEASRLGSIVSRLRATSASVSSTPETPNSGVAPLASAILTRCCADAGTAAGRSAAADKTA